MVGLDPISGVERYTFGSFELSNGIGLVPLMIGVFVLGEVFDQLEKTGQQVETVPEGDADGASLTWAEYRPCLPHAIRGGFIGAGVGVLPGLGSAIAAFISYGEGKRRAANAEQWGKGALEGVAAPEAANNAVSGPSMAPLLTLGIPGSTIGAILLGVFLIHGIQVGPTLFLTSKDLVYQLFACGLLGIAAYGLIGYFGASQVAASDPAHSHQLALPDDLPHELCRRLLGAGIYVRRAGYGRRGRRWLADAQVRVQRRRLRHRLCPRQGGRRRRSGSPS